MFRNERKPSRHFELLSFWCANPRPNERFLQPKTLCDLSRGADLWSLELRATLHGNRAGFAASRRPAAVPVSPGAPANRAPGGALSSPDVPGDFGGRGPWAPARLLRAKDELPKPGRPAERG